MDSVRAALVTGVDGGTGATGIWRAEVSDRIGFVYVGLGEKEEAYRWFDRALEEHDAFLSQLWSWSDYDSWHKDLHFQQLARGMNLIP